ncbi:MAG: right-handed parallel beta-helix repeat-containing protein, partial [candidate division WOR-3 bacterium]
MRHSMSLWVLLLLLSAGLAVGQYSGTYTIMPSGGDFSSHDEASDSLTAYGVVGPCTLLMYTGTYYGQAYFNNVGWDSVEVVFKAAPGHTPVVEYSDYPFYIYYTDNIRLDGLGIVSTGSYGIYNYYSDKTQVHNCSIISASSYGVYFYYADTCRLVGNRISAGTYGVYWYYSTCRYIEGNHIKAPSSYGMYLYNSSSSSAYYDTIVNNMVYSGSNYPAYKYYAYYTYWAYNTFWGTSSYGMYCNYNYNTKYYNNIFCNSANNYNLYYINGSIDSCDYNCWYNFAGYANIIYYNNTAYSWANWRAAGWDARGMNKDPRVGGPLNLHLKTGSPCIDSGVTISRWPKDIDGDTRGTYTDIGADEYTSVGSPMSGTYLIHQDPDSGHYSSFGEAISEVAVRGCSGDVFLNVAAGTYSEDVMITVLGNSPYDVTFQARGTDSVSIAGYINMIAAKRVKFRGLHVFSPASWAVRMYYSGAAPYNGCDSCVIADCRLYASTYPIYAYYRFNYCSIVGNFIRATSSYGIYCYGYNLNANQKNVIANNIVSGWTSSGLYMYYHDSTQLIFNTFYGSGSYGMYDGYGYNRMRYHGNIFNGNTYGWYKYYGDAIPTYSDYNCFNGGTNPIYHINAGGSITLATWRAYSDRDSHSIQQDPLCFSSTDGHLKPMSPCRDSAANYAGFPLDADGETRATPTDIGADDFQLIGSPLSGTYLIHQDPDSGDYSSFAEAVHDLTLWGTSGPVAFNVAGDSYVEPVRVGDIYGGYPVTFQARGTERVVIDGRAASYAVDMVGSENVRFRNFTIFGSNYGVRFFHSGTDGCDGCMLEGCTVRSPHGVYMYYYTDHCSLVGNFIQANSSYGVYLYGSSSDRNIGNVFINNWVSHWTSYAFYAYYHDSTRMIYNSAYGRGSNAYHDYYGYFEHMQNNIFYGNSYGWQKYYGNTLPAVSNYNCWWSNNASNYVINHSSYGALTLADWQGYSNLDTNSISRDPMFASLTDLHLKTSSPCRDSGLAISGISVDVDGDTRDSDPCIGCDEWRSPGAPMSGIYKVHPNPDSGDYVSFIEGLEDVGQRGFGGDVTLDGYTGTYAGSIVLAGIGNDTFGLTLQAHPGEVCVIIPTTGNVGVYMVANDNITVDGLSFFGQYYPVYMYYSGSEGCSNCRIVNNDINSVGYGIYLYYSGSDNVIAGNKVRTTGSYGIYAYGNSSARPKRNMLYNNMFFGASSYGIYMYYQDSAVVAYNSLYGTSTAGYGACFYYNDNLTVTNNISVNPYSYTYGTAWRANQNTTGLVWNHNCGYAPNSTYFGYLNGSYVNWSGWQAGGMDANGLNVDPCYMSSSDLHIQDSSACIGAGSPVSGITTDIDAELRSWSRPAIGCDEYPVDVSVDAVLAPVGLVPRLYAVTPRAVVSHVEGPIVKGNLIMVFDTAGLEFWRDTSDMFMVRPGESETLGFAPFMPQFSYTGVNMTCWHTGTPDVNPSDDTVQGGFSVDIIDVEVLRIDVPSGRIGLGDTVRPSVLLRNNGLGNRSLYVTCIIDDRSFGEAGIETPEVSLGRADARTGQANLEAAVVETGEADPWEEVAMVEVEAEEGTSPMEGEADAIKYATIQGVTIRSADTARMRFAVPWVATPPGTYFVRAWHQLLTDEDRSNDSLQQDFEVVARNPDVGIEQVVYPRSFEQPETDLVPTLRCRNYREEMASFTGYVVLYDPYTDSLRYRESVNVSGLVGGSSMLVRFPTINLGSDTGAWGAYCSLYCAGDIAPANNVVSLSFTVGSPYPPGWAEMASMPLGPSGKPVKRGAWATLHAPSDKIFVTKGNKTKDFYSYDPYADLWDTLSGMPFETHPTWSGESPEKGARGVSDGEDIIYVTQGNNTLGFWAYSVSMDSWWILPDVP